MQTLPQATSHNLFSFSGKHICDFAFRNEIIVTLLGQTNNMSIMKVGEMGVMGYSDR